MRVSRAVERDGRLLESSSGLKSSLMQVVAAWPLGLGAAFELALKPSLRHPRLGPTFVQSFLEPLLVRFEVMLSNRQAAGELRPGPAREAALALVSPVLLGLLHQKSLSGERCRPLDLAAFVSLHVERFVDAWRGPVPA